VNLSERTNWPPEENRLSTLLRARRTSGRAIIDLTETNPTSCGIPYPVAEMLAAFRTERILAYEPDPRGLASARQAVSTYYAARRVTVEPSRIFLTSGTSESYTHLFRILCDAGDEVAVPRPSYPLFDYLAQIGDVKLRHYCLGYDHGWSIDLASLERAITPATRAIILVSPHNPTGMTIRDLRPILRIAGMRGLPLIIDEVFADYVFDGSPTDILLQRSATPLFILNGISKLAGLPQMKLGWIAATGDPGADFLNRLETVTDTFLSVNTPVQVALPDLLREAKGVRNAIFARICTNFAYAREAASRENLCTILACDGGWQAILKVPRTKSDEEWAVELLDRHGVVVYPGYFFDFEDEGHLVLSLLPREDIFRKGLDILLDHVRLHA
jgi:hypothetical protein